MAVESTRQRHETQDGTVVEAPGSSAAEAQPEESLTSEAKTAGCTRLRPCFRFFWATGCRNKQCAVCHDETPRES